MKKVLGAVSGFAVASVFVLGAVPAAASASPDRVLPEDPYAVGKNSETYFITGEEIQKILGTKNAWGEEDASVGGIIKPDRILLTKTYKSNGEPFAETHPGKFLTAQPGITIGATSEETEKAWEFLKGTYDDAVAVTGSPVKIIKETENYMEVQIKDHYSPKRSVWVFENTDGIVSSGECSTLKKKVSDAALLKCATLIKDAQASKSAVAFPER